MISEKERLASDIEYYKMEIESLDELIKEYRNRIRWAINQKIINQRKLREAATQLFKSRGKQ